MRARWSRPLKSLFWRSMVAFGTVVVATLLLGTLLLITIMQRASAGRPGQLLLIDGRGGALLGVALLGVALLGLLAVYALCRVFARPIAPRSSPSWVRSSGSTR